MCALSRRGGGSRATLPLRLGSGRRALKVRRRTDAGLVGRQRENVSLGDGSHAGTLFGSTCATNGALLLASGHSPSGQVSSFCDGRAPAP